MYGGYPGEDKMGIAIGTEAFMAINAKAPEADQKATIDFVNWLFSDEKGKKHVTEELGFIAPFKSFGDAAPNDPLAKEIARYLGSDMTPVPWDFTTFPSQAFKDNYEQLLAQYASGNIQWDEVVTKAKESWAAEKAAVNG